jgi:hypothetical protein
VCLSCRPSLGPPKPTTGDNGSAIFTVAEPFTLANPLANRTPSRRMIKLKTVGLSYGALRKECIEAVRHWPGCETVSGIQIIRDNTPTGFTVRITLYREADKKIADRAISCVQREKRRQFHLLD